MPSSMTGKEDEENNIASVLVLQKMTTNCRFHTVASRVYVFSTIAFRVSTRL